MSVCVGMCDQVEDMLKRSFAEFHAQRSHPEALQKLAEGKARLDALRAKPWPHSPHATWALGCWMSALHETAVSMSNGAEIVYA